jgi:hypothetical protein
LERDFIIAKPLNTALKRVLPPRKVESLRARRAILSGKIRSLVDDPRQFNRNWAKRECPVCGYVGRFWSFGSPPRAEAMCPNCMSLERHRLLQLLFRDHLDRVPRTTRVLHFAPEAFIREKLSRQCRYVSVDVVPYRVDVSCIMEHIPFAHNQFDLVIANHVLEHVSEEAKALSEIYRVLDPDGVSILSVPQIFGWEETYEDDAITNPDERRVHFGQVDHRRLYGRDFAAKLCAAGFDVDAFQVNRPDEIRFALTRGETLYICTPRTQARHDTHDSMDRPLSIGPSAL